VCHDTLIQGDQSCIRVLLRIYLKISDTGFTILGPITWMTQLYRNGIIISTGTLKDRDREHCTEHWEQNNDIMQSNSAL